MPAHQELALHELDDEANPIVAEPEPELEALSDTAAPEAVTEDAAEFGDDPGESFAAGPGDAPVNGADETLESGEGHPRHVVDDPDGGVPIEHVARPAETEAE